MILRRRYQDISNKKHVDGKNGCRDLSKIAWRLWFSSIYLLLLLDTDYEIIREGDRGVRKSDLRPSEGGGKIIGTIAVCVKEDPDMRDPPGKLFYDRSCIKLVFCFEEVSFFIQLQKENYYASSKESSNVPKKS